MTEISQRELRNDSGKVMRMVAEGHTFVITSHSQPVGELRPLRRRRLVNSRIAAEAFRGIPTIERQKFTDDIDAYVSQEIDYER